MGAVVGIAIALHSDAAGLPKAVAPLLAKYCADCHGARKQKGDLRLDKLNPDLVQGPDADLWHEVLNKLNVGEMPPEDEGQPTLAEREILTGWLTTELAKAAEARRQGSGGVVFRRLNRREYNNTLNDLFGLDLDIQNMLPPERPSKEGFLNNGSELVMSPLHFEYYLKIARHYLNKAVVTGEQPSSEGFRGQIQGSGGKLKLSGEKLNGEERHGVNLTVRNKRSNNDRRVEIRENSLVLPPAVRATGVYIPARQGPQPALQVKFREFPNGGKVRIRVTASALPAASSAVAGGTGPVQVEVFAPNFSDAKLTTYQGRVPATTQRVPRLSFDQLGVEIEKVSLRYTAQLNIAQTGDYTFYLTSDDGSRLYLNGKEIIDNDGSHGMTEKTGQLRLKNGVNDIVVTYFDSGGGDGLTVDWSGPGFNRRPVDRFVQPKVAEKPQPKPEEPVLKEFPYLAVMMGNHLDDGVELKQVGTAQEVRALSDKPQVYEFVGRMEKLPLPFRKKNLQHSGDLNQAMLMIKNAYEPHLREQDPRLQIHAVELEMNYHEAWPPASHQRIFVASKNRDEPAVYAREIFTSFLQRAYRRPPGDGEVERLMALWRDYQSNPACEEGRTTFEDSIREVLPAALISPAFLYLVEPCEANRRRPLSDYELASRLSYFLWGTMPDAALLEVAGAGKLRAPEGLRAQARRLLADPRSEEFIASFIDEWLDLDALDRVPVDRKRHTTYQPYLRAAMRQETRGFFAEILRKDLSALNLLDSDWVYINPMLARHYGIPNVNGEAFRVVQVQPELHRGGVLTQASFLTGNSDGVDSHPIKRGTWLLKRLLNDPPPPPPPNVPDLDRKDPELAGKSLKEQLELHRSNTACYSCHRKIDPFGVPFENYNTVGQWRTNVNGKPVEAMDELPDGTKIDGVGALKTYLLEKRSGQFGRAITSKLLAYALGRSLTFADDKEVNRLAEGFRQDSYRLRPLIEAIVVSETFTTK